MIVTFIAIYEYNEINILNFNLTHLGAQSAYNYKELIFSYGLQNCKPANANDDMCRFLLNQAIEKKHLNN